MRTTFDLLVLARQAEEWLSSQGLDPASVPDWTELPQLPPAAPPPVRPVWRIPMTDLDRRLEAPARVRCRTLRSKYDPDEASPWAFVPTSNDEVWLVLTKQIARPTTS